MCVYKGWVWKEGGMLVKKSVKKKTTAIWAVWIAMIDEYGHLQYAKVQSSKKRGIEYADKPERD